MIVQLTSLLNNRCRVKKLVLIGSNSVVRYWLVLVALAFSLEDASFASPTYCRWYSNLLSQWDRFSSPEFCQLSFISWIHLLRTHGVFIQVSTRTYFFLWSLSLKNFKISMVQTLLKKIVMELCLLIVTSWYEFS